LLIESPERSQVQPRGARQGTTCQRVSLQGHGDFTVIRASNQKAAKESKAALTCTLSMFPQIFGKYVLEARDRCGRHGAGLPRYLRGAVGFEKRLVVKQIRTELASDEAFVTRFVEERRRRSNSATPTSCRFTSSESSRRVLHRDGAV